MTTAVNISKLGHLKVANICILLPAWSPKIKISSLPHRFKWYGIRSTRRKQLARISANQCCGAELVLVGSGSGPLKSRSRILYNEKFVSSNL